MDRATQERLWTASEGSNGCAVAAARAGRLGGIAKDLPQAVTANLGFGSGCLRHDAGPRLKLVITGRGARQYTTVPLWFAMSSATWRR